LSESGISTGVCTSTPRDVGSSVPADILSTATDYSIRVGTDAASAEICLHVAADLCSDDRGERRSTSEEQGGTSEHDSGLAGFSLAEAIVKQQNQQPVIQV
jgi:hypothetical protein